MAQRHIQHLIMQVFAHLDISQLFFEEGDGHVMISNQALCLDLQIGTEFVLLHSYHGNYV